MQVAVIGIGRSMRGDDAAGLEAVRLWQRKHARTAGRTDVRAAIVEEPGLELLDLLDGMDAAILVDAVCSGAAAGTLHQIDLDELSDFREGPASAHSWGVVEVLRLGGALHLQSAQRAIRLLGIEAEQMEIGAGLSDPVAGALPAACNAIENEVTALLQG